MQVKSPLTWVVAPPSKTYNNIMVSTGIIYPSIQIRDSQFLNRSGQQWFFSRPRPYIKLTRNPRRARNQLKCSNFFDFQSCALRFSGYFCLCLIRWFPGSFAKYESVWGCLTVVSLILAHDFHAARSQRSEPSDSPIRDYPSVQSWVTLTLLLHPREHWT